jgi:hypothetical protein
VQDRSIYLLRLTHERGRQTDLSYAVFGRDANLTHVHIGDLAKLYQVQFEYVDLSGANIGDFANFGEAVFGNESVLAAAVFGEGTDFFDAKFEDFVNFSATVFGEGTKFATAKFGDEINFAGVTFGDEADFESATFYGDVSFDAMSIEKCRRTVLDLTNQRANALQRSLEAIQRSGNEPDSFGTLNFRAARFNGVANFFGRTFKKPADFIRVAFNQLPNFDDCSGVGRIDFYGAKFRFTGRLGTRSEFDPRPILSTPGWTSDSQVVIRLRTFRKLAEDTKNHDLERDLYIEERKAERGVMFADYFGQRRMVLLISHSTWIVIMSAYWLLANYGRSFMRPLLALLVSVFIFHAWYSMVLSPPGKAGESEFRQAVWAFTIANAVPIVGALTLEKEVKELIYCASNPPATISVEDSSPSCIPVPTTAFQLLALVQSVLSALLVFFSALALRNFFKLR